MYDIKCPNCGDVRKVKAKKPWMVGEIPFMKICKSCCQVGKPKSEEHRQKLSESVKLNQTDEVRQQKSDFMKAHPEIWSESLVAGAGGGWNKGQTTGSHSEETKKKISETMTETRKVKKWK